ncbi:TolC family protein [Flavobacterium cellulosilyticum]|uniref:TolC family protein n=1 Tax=Flavobacterium cellulosilyticum TaxID=2541731 RepID=A0A4R5C8J8_9FLAO|nr:TolC family protein [Flavobacterium cellulosilyticum]TDD95485.1 TolC family protein [Flavobacterium cellulosilyticum]
MKITKRNFIKPMQQLLGVMVMVVLSCPTHAQERFPIDLETVMQLSGANSLTVQEYLLKHELAVAEQAKAKEWWLPNLYAGFTTHYLSGAAMNTDGRIFTDVEQNNLWAGLGISAEIDFSKGIYQTLAAKQKVQAADYFSIAEKNKAILQSIEVYFDMQNEQLKYISLQRLVSQADTLSQQLKIQVDAGLRYQSEYLLANSNFNHLKIEMFQAKLGWYKKSALLSNLLNLEQQTQLISTETNLVPFELTPSLAEEKTIETHPQYLGLQSELHALQTENKTVNQGLLLPKLRIGADNGAFGRYSDNLHTTYQVNVSLLWNIPFGRFSYQGDIKKGKARIDLQENKVSQFKNQYQQEIVVATTEIQMAEEQISVAKQALAFSIEAVNQSIERQKIGTAKPFEVYQAQQFNLQAQLDYLKIISDFNKAQYALKVAKGDNL